MYLTCRQCHEILIATKVGRFFGQLLLILSIIQCNKVLSLYIIIS